MSHRIVVALAGTLFLLGPGSASAQPPATKTDLGTNAALRYWQAFAHLPARDKEQEKILAEWSTTPLDDAARKLIAAGSASLHSLHRGTSIPRCDWGLDYDEGALLLLPHLERARTLTRLACLRARAHFEQGNLEAGVTDATDALVLARHVACDRTTLIAALVQYHLERLALDALAAFLPKLDAVNLQRLVARLEALPAPGSCRNSLSVEKEFVADWFIKRIQSRKDRWREEVVQIFANAEESDAFLKAVEPATPERVVQLLQDLTPVYDEMAEVLALPHDQFVPRWEALQQKARAANPIARFLLPAMDKVFVAEQAAQARFALLRAAIAVVQGGPEKLQSIRDPFGTGPFAYRKLPHGFELGSKLVHKDQPVTLAVGRKMD